MRIIKRKYNENNDAFIHLWDYTSIIVYTGIIVYTVFFYLFTLRLIAFMTTVKTCVKFYR